MFLIAKQIIAKFSLKKKKSCVFALHSGSKMLEETTKKKRFSKVTTNKKLFGMLQIR